MKTRVLSILAAALFCSVSTLSPIAYAQANDETPTTESRVLSLTLNNPYTADAYENMQKLINYVKGAKSGSYIRFMTYSIDNTTITDELIKAKRDRGVHVQIIVREALSTTSYNRLKSVLGDVYTYDSSFIIKCDNACRDNNTQSGDNSMHMKVFMFSNTTYGQVWSIGSFHPTEFSSKFQFNDLAFAQNQCVYDELRTVFYQMAADREAAPRKPVLCGQFYVMVYPQPVDGRDMFIEALNKVHCRGANGGTGSAGRTVIRVQHAVLRSSRGAEFAAKLKSLHREGCIIDIILGADINIADRLLTDARYLKGLRYIQRTNDNAAATHMKSMLISGNYGSDTSSRLVYTGSLNQENGQQWRDDIQLRINDNETFLRYVEHFNEVKRYYNRSL